MQPVNPDYLTVSELLAAGPDGLTDLGNGHFIHKVQAGDTLSSIARSYARTLGMNVTANSLYDANKAEIGPDPNVLNVHQALRIPGLDEQVVKLGSVNGLTIYNTTIYHTVQPGDTLSSIARRYNEPFGLAMSAQSIHDSNMDVIGSDPNRIRPGQRLVLPGLTELAPPTVEPPAPVTPKPSNIDSFNGRTVLHTMADVRWEDGRLESLPINHFDWDPTTRQFAGTSFWDAFALAGKYVHDRPSEMTMVGVIRDDKGQYWISDMPGGEISDNLDDSYQVLKLYKAPADPAMKAFAEPGYQDVFLPVPEDG